MLIKLRALEPEDLSFLYEIENEMEDWQYGTTNTPISQYALRQYIATCKNDIFEDGQLRLAVDVEGEMVGLVDLTNFNPMHRRAEVGIVIRNNKRQMGYGARALGLLADYAKRIVGLHQLYAVVSSDNKSAQKLFTSCSYNETQILKDWLFSVSGETHDACLFQRFLD